MLAAIEEDERNQLLQPWTHMPLPDELQAPVSKLCLGPCWYQDAVRGLDWAVQRRQPSTRALAAIEEDERNQLLQIWTHTPLPGELQAPVSTLCLGPCWYQDTVKCWSGTSSDANPQHMQ